MSFYINCKNLAVKIFFSDNGEALMDTWLTQGLCSYFGPNKCVGKTNDCSPPGEFFTVIVIFVNGNTNSK